MNYSINLSRSSSFDVDAVSGTDGVHRIDSAANGMTYFRADVGIGGQSVVHTQTDAETVVAYYEQPTERTFASSGMIMGAPVASALGTYRYAIDIYLGQEFSLGMTLSVQAHSSASGEAGAAATISSMNSFDWGGIQSVTIDGQPVEFSVISASGTDWTQPYTSPIPEAPTLALLLTGLGVVLRRSVKLRNAAVG